MSKAAIGCAEQVHGHDRDGELRDGLERGSATVVEHDGRITGLRHRHRVFWSRGG